ncbi:VCBS repeat domain-containing M23 family metallopeptidase [Microbacterium sp.]|uniref:VCBS repeat domain-containing M23 family metallopeptidase n=1 Tax=Microbacterium sp. TaxID=51671 RepID=UPI002FE18E2C
MSRRARFGVVAAVLAVLVGALAPTMTSGAPAVAATDGQMIYPASGNIQSKVNDGCRGNFRAHEGIDITGPGGTPILAAYDGVIKTRTANSGYGNYTDIEHPGGYVTRYAHMASTGIYAPGTRVTRGQQIGVIGMTGATSANHLHFEVRRNGAVYTAINNGFTCLANVVRGNVIPMSFPGLGAPRNASVVSADYDGDGKADLLVVAEDSDLRHYSGAGTGSFYPPSVVTSAWGLYRHLTHADLNGDGLGDMLAVRSDGALEFYGSTASGGFGVHEIIASDWYDKLHVTSGADYDGDGKQDVVAVSPDGVLTVFRGNGAGGLTVPNSVRGGGWQNMRFLVGGDFNNDGLGDLMALDNGGVLYFYPGQAGAFGARQVVAGDWSGVTGLTGGVDYNGDGLPDLLVRVASGDLYFHPGTGGPAFRSRVLIGAGWGPFPQIE